MTEGRRTPDEARALLAPIDWNFHGDAAAPGLLGIHWYPCKFPLPLARTLVRALAVPDLSVLDPFVGSGTTLVAAQELGHSAIGFDLNPLAVLISNGVTSLADVKVFRSSLVEVLAQVDSGQPESRFRRWKGERPPSELDYWFHPDTLDELHSLWSAILNLPPSSAKRTLLLCFSSILKSVCSQRNHWGWVCDNVKPSTLVYRNAVTAFAQRSQMAATALGSLSPGRPPSVVVHGNALDELRRLPDESVGFVITSPPYQGMTDYVRSQRLTLLWLGEDVDSLKGSEIGARFKRHRQLALEEYKQELFLVLTEVQRVLVRGGYLAAVLGESRRRQGSLAAIFEIFDKGGWESVYRSERWLPVQRALSSRSAREEIAVFQNG